MFYQFLGHPDLTIFPRRNLAIAEEFNAKSIKLRALGSWKTARSRIRVRVLRMSSALIANTVLFDPGIGAQGRQARFQAGRSPVARCAPNMEST